MRRVSEFMLGFLFAAAIAAVILLFVADPQTYHQICETNQYSGKESCSSHDVPYIVIWYIGHWFNEASAVITAIATAFIGVFTATLWKSNEKATRLARRMGVIARRQMLISGQQTDIQRKQHALGRLQYFVTHRPRLKIRHVSIETADHIGHPTIFFDNGETVRGGLAVVNVGGSEATIVDTRYRIFFTNTGLPLSAPYDPPNGRANLLLTDQVLAIGESCAVPITDTVVMEPDAHTGTIILRRFDREEWVIYVMGTIRYRDEGGAERFMGFCRKRERDGRFSAVDDPDYEWED